MDRKFTPGDGVGGVVERVVPNFLVSNFNWTSPYPWVVPSLYKTWLRRLSDKIENLQGVEEVPTSCFYYGNKSSPTSCFGEIFRFPQRPGCCRSTSPLSSRHRYYCEVGSRPVTRHFKDHPGSSGNSKLGQPTPADQRKVSSTWALRDWGGLSYCDRIILRGNDGLRRTCQNPRGWSPMMIIPF